MIEAEIFVALLVGLAGNLASNSIYDLATLRHKDEADFPDPVSASIMHSAEHHPDPAVAVAGLTAWSASDAFQEFLSVIRSTPDSLTVSKVMESLRQGGPDAESLAETPYAADVVVAFLQELNTALLRSKDGLAVLDQRLRGMAAHFNDQLADITSQLKAAPAFLSISAFYEQQRRHDPLGFAVPYTRDGWS